VSLSQLSYINEEQMPISLKELGEVKVGPFEVEYDGHWKSTEAGEIDKI
jgi:hypothetical protein